MKNERLGEILREELDALELSASALPTDDGGTAKRGGRKEGLRRNGEDVASCRVRHLCLPPMCPPGFASSFRRMPESRTEEGEDIMSFHTRFNRAGTDAKGGRA